MFKLFSQDGSSPPRGLKWRSHPVFIVSTFGMGAFTDIALYGLIVPVLPFMLKERVHVPEADLQSTTSNLLAIYAVASLLSSPVAGVLSDRFCSSRQLPFMLSLILLLISTVLLALGRTVAELAVARFFQGMSGGAVWTIGLALIVDTVGQEHLGKTMGTVFSFTSVAGLFSPMLGGLIFAKVGYNGVFGLGLSLIGVDLILRLFMIERRDAEKWTNALNQSGEEDSSHDRPEDTEQTPLLGNSNNGSDYYRLPEPKSYLTRSFPILLVFRDLGLLTATWITFMQAFLLGAFDATIPLVASEQFKFDSLNAGLLFLPLGCSDFLLGPVFGWFVDRYGTRMISILGFVLLVPALTLLRLVTEPALERKLDNGHLIALYASILAINGLGLAVINSPAIVESGVIMEKYYSANKDVFERAPYAQLYGIGSMLFSAGLTFGPLLAGYLRQRIGYGNMNAVLAGICGFTAILSALYMGRTHKKPS